MICMELARVWLGSLCPSCRGVNLEIPNGRLFFSLASEISDLSLATCTRRERNPEVLVLYVSYDLRLTNGACPGF